MNILLAAIFTALGVGCALAAWTGFRGWVCDARRGYKVPAHVQRSPALRERANQLVKFWCTGAAILSAAPLPPLFMAPQNEEVSTTGLAVLALYGLLVICVAGFPFEKIKQLKSD